MLNKISQTLLHSFPILISSPPFLFPILKIVSLPPHSRRRRLHLDPTELDDPLSTPLLTTGWTPQPLTPKSGRVDGRAGFNYLLPYYMCRDELPDDEPRLIFSRLSLVDHIRLRLVCKRWKTLLEEENIRPLDRLPWIMFYPRNQREDYDKGVPVRSLCKLYVPSQRKTYTIEDGFFKGHEEEQRGKFTDVGALYSKKGWVMFRRKLSEVRMFLYSPFTGGVVEDLPELKRWVDKAAFSCSPPTSEECVFFAYRTVLLDTRRGEISTCRRGDQAWKTTEVNISVNHRWVHIDSVVYSNGTFYCLFNRGGLGAFTVATEQWVVLFGGATEFGAFDHLTEFDGQLFVMAKGTPYRCCRFDFSRKTWVEEEVHGDQAVFVEAFFLSCQSNPCLVPAEGEASDLAGKFTSLLDSSQVMSYNSSIPRSYMQRVRSYSNVNTQDRNLRPVWIQPPPNCSFLIK